MGSCVYVCLILRLTEQQLIVCAMENVYPIPSNFNLLFTRIIIKNTTMLLLSPYSVDVEKTDALSNVYSSLHSFSYITISLLSQCSIT